MLQTLKNRIVAIPAVLIPALAGLAGRIAGLLPLQLAAAALLLLLAGLTARNLEPRPDYASNFRPARMWLLAFPAALLLAASAFSLFTLRQRMAAAATLILALGMAASAFFAIGKKQPSPLLYMAMTAAVICRLIPDFRAWSVDPMLQDYVFRLFAMLFVLFSVFSLSGFCMDEGKRRTAVFCCVPAIGFSLMAAGDGAGRSTWIACALYFIAVLWSLLAPGAAKQGGDAP